MFTLYRNKLFPTAHTISLISAEYYFLLKYSSRDVYNICLPLHKYRIPFARAIASLIISLLIKPRACRGHATPRQWRPHRHGSTLRSKHLSLSPSLPAPWRPLSRISIVICFYYFLYYLYQYYDVFYENLYQIHSCAPVVAFGAYLLWCYDHKSISFLSEFNTLLE